MDSTRCRIQGADNLEVFGADRRPMHLSSSDTHKRSIKKAPAMPASNTRIGTDMFRASCPYPIVLRKSRLSHDSVGTIAPAGAWFPREKKNSVDGQSARPIPVHNPKREGLLSDKDPPASRRVGRAR